jgi:hypothetical protein
LADARPLSDGQLKTLATLDARLVSRFAAEYMLKAPDREMPEAQSRYPSAAITLYGRLCEILATDGTREAAPGLRKAIHEGRFLPVEAPTPRGLPWMAVLAIARRDPWPQVESTLAELLDRTELLADHGFLTAGGTGTGAPSSPSAHRQSRVGPELAATAAGILLAGRGESPAAFGLASVDEPLLSHVGLTGYRFASPDARERIKAWWKRATAAEGE